MNWFIWLLVVPIAGIILLWPADMKVGFELKEDETLKTFFFECSCIWFRTHRRWDYNYPEGGFLEAFLFKGLDNYVMSEPKQIPSLRQIIEYYPALKNRLLYLNLYLRLYQKTLKFLKISDLEWDSTIGGYDAMQTALASGILWAAKGMGIAILSRLCRLESLFVNVRPDFASPVFNSRFSCILKMRMAHYIIIVIYFIVLKVRWCLYGRATRKIRPAY